MSKKVEKNDKPETEQEEFMKAFLAAWEPKAVFLCYPVELRDRILKYCYHAGCGVDEAVALVNDLHHQTCLLMGNFAALKMNDNQALKAMKKMQEDALKCEASK